VVEFPQVGHTALPHRARTGTRRAESELLLASSLRGFRLLVGLGFTARRGATHLRFTFWWRRCTSSQSFAIPQLVPAPHWDLQHPSPPRSRTAAGPNDDTLRSTTTGRACTLRYLFTTLTPMHTWPSCAHLERAGVEDGDWDGDGEVRGDGRLNMEMENKMEIRTAHSRISVDMSMPSEMGMTKCGYAYNADTALRTRGSGRERRRRHRRSPYASSCAYAWRWPGHMFSPSPAIALGPILAVVERASASASRCRATACAGGPGRPQWTSSARNVGLEVVSGPLLVLLAPAFLVLTDAAQRMRACTRDLDKTLGADVRARVSVEVGMESASPGPGARTSSPRGCGVCAATAVVHICAHQSEGRRGAGYGCICCRAPGRAHTLLQS
jgi:hypothetical protein